MTLVINMKKIANITTTIIDIPTIRPHKLSMTSMAMQSMVIVRILDTDGAEGLGEGTTIGGLAYGPESPESIKKILILILHRYFLISPITVLKASLKCSISQFEVTLLRNQQLRQHFLI